jgi:hypothetical protein
METRRCFTGDMKFATRNTLDSCSQSLKSIFWRRELQRDSSTRTPSTTTPNDYLTVTLERPRFHKAALKLVRTFLSKERALETVSCSSPKKSTGSKPAQPRSSTSGLHWISRSSTGELAVI